MKFINKTVCLCSFFSENIVRVESYGREYKFKMVDFDWMGDFVENYICCNSRKAMNETFKFS